MIRSMTGYGKGVFEDASGKISVEMRAVNNKFCEMNFRLPRLFNPFEDRLRKSFNSQVSRGRVDVYISFTANPDGADTIRYNPQIAGAYHEILKQISEEFAPEVSHSTMMNLIARFPDVVEIDRETPDDKVDGLWNGLKAAADEALVKFINMREIEGQALKADFLGRVDNMDKILKVIETHAPKVVEHQRERLKKRMEEALATVAIDEARFLNEVAHFADKTDINEEITRMKSHMAQFADVLEEEGAIGRKLDFVTQEMAREANTMGSKANYADLSKIVIELKSEVEKIREQVQNIE
ncbi:MAG: YicC family protein [Defluviitaleaceae bacterium]|nr:YicC family protein [Defluviitaleaceae bacterium]